MKEVSDQINYGYKLKVVLIKDEEEVSESPSGTGK